MPGAIDIVINLHTPEVLAFRPKWYEGFLGGKIGAAMAAKHRAVGNRRTAFRAVHVERSFGGNNCFCRDILRRKRWAFQRTRSAPPPA